MTKGPGELSPGPFVSVPAVKLGMVSGIAIREATREDRGGVTALVQYVLSVEYGRSIDFDVSDADLIDFPTAYSDGAFWVAELDGAVVGTVGISAGELGVAKLRKMYLAPEVRGRGLGRRLLEVSIAEARRRGFLEIRLETMSTMVAAIGLYESAGFRPVEAVPESPRCDRVYVLGLA